MLIGCAISKSKIHNTNNQFSLISDTIYCEFKAWKEYRPNLLPRNEVVLKNGKPFVPYSAKYNILNVIDSQLVFQLNDSIFTFNLYTSKSSYLTKHAPIYSRNICCKTKSKLFFRDEYNVDPYIISELNYTTNEITTSKFSVDGLLSSGSVYHSNILEESNNMYYFAKDYKLFLVDSNFQVIDSVNINTFYFTKASDSRNGFLIYVINDLYIPDGRNEISLYNLTTKTNSTFILPFHSDYLTNIVCLKFSKFNPNKIYYLEKNSGIYEFDLINSKSKVILECCPNRNIVDFVLSADNTKIYAQTWSNIYEIDLRQVNALPKILITTKYFITI